MTARFLTRDPDPGDTAEPATLNPYVYCAGDPVNNIDPSGESAIALPLVHLAGVVVVAGYLWSPQGKRDMERAASSIAAGYRIYRADKAAKGRRFSPEQQEVARRAKEALRRGKQGKPISESEADELVDAARRAGLSAQKHGVHKRGALKKPHIHVGPIGHIVFRR